MSLPFPNITQLPDDEPDAIPELWNTRYDEIDENFASLDLRATAVANALSNHANILVTPDPHPVYLTSAEGDSKIEAAVAALVNASPGTLDTLSELASALGNDSNFSATMIGMLAAKAPLLSPALSGNPTAPTAHPDNKSTSIATTEFSNKCAEKKDRYQEGTAFSTTGASPNFVLDIGSGTPVSNYVNGLRFSVKFNANSSGATNFLIVQGLIAKEIKQYNSSGALENAVFVANQISDIVFQDDKWIMLNPLPLFSPTNHVHTAAQISDFLSAVSAMFGLNNSTDSYGNGWGYLSFPNGLIMQWRAAWAGKDNTFLANALPIPFPNKVLMATASLYGDNSYIGVAVDWLRTHWEGGIQNSTRNKTHIYLRGSYTIDIACFVFVIGH